MEIKQVPSNAFMLKAAGVSLGDNGANSKTAPFHMVALSGQPIDTPWFGTVIYDLSGMTLNKSRLPIDYLHNKETIIGYANKFDFSGGQLKADGVIHSVRPGDMAEEVIIRGKGDPENGIEPQPYEASVETCIDTIEEIPEGYTVTVNEQSYQGPISVIRNSNLRAIAVCPLGMDSATVTEFSEKEKMKSVTVYKMGEQMNEQNTVVETEVKTEVETENTVIETETQPETETQATQAETVENTVVEADGQGETVENTVVEAEVEEQPEVETEKENAVVEPEVSVVSLSANLTELSAKFEAIAKENMELKSRLDAIASCGNSQPISLSAANTSTNGEDMEFNTKFNLYKQTMSDSAARIAASLKFIK